jgi:hypothetical protein
MCSSLACPLTSGLNDALCSTHDYVIKDAVKSILDKYDAAVSDTQVFDVILCNQSVYKVVCTWRRML